ncbi:MAG: FecR domain-containing protein [Pseudomonadota bacterium]
MLRALLKSALAGMLLAYGAILSAAPQGEISYEVQPADTLYDLTAEYLNNPAALAEVRRLNRVRNPRLMQIGRVLKIPRRLLKYRPADLELQSFSGAVRITQGGQVIPPALGLALLEGNEISTGRNSFVSIAGRGASQVSIPSNSRVRIVDARRYLINDEIDIQLRVLEGRGEVVAPPVEGDGRYRVGTPIAVTAVRGTGFRVAFVPDDERNLTEVVEGQVLVAAGNDEQITEVGFGVAAAADGISEPQELLPAPELVEPGRIQTAAISEFQIEPVAGASRYRTQLARDAGFIEIVAEIFGEATLAQFPELEDGRYFVRSRAVSEIGLEGFSKAYSFRRKRAGVTASAEPSELEDAFKFAWRSQGDGEVFYAFQLWQSGQPNQLLVDEVALRNTAVLVSELESGEYRWRVASFQIDEGDIIKVWGPVQELTIAD